MLESARCHNLSALPCDFSKRLNVKRGKSRPKPSVVKSMYTHGFGQKIAALFYRSKSQRLLLRMRGRQLCRQGQEQKVLIHIDPCLAEPRPTGSLMNN